VPGGRTGAHPWGCAPRAPGTSSGSRRKLLDLLGSSTASSTPATSFEADLRRVGAIRLARLLPKLITFDSKGVRRLRRGGGFLTSLLPFVLLFGFWIFLMNQLQGGGSKVMSLARPPPSGWRPRLAKIGFQGRGPAWRGGRGAQEIKEVPREPEEVPGARGAHPQGVLLSARPAHR